MKKIFSTALLLSLILSALVSLTGCQGETQEKVLSKTVSYVYFNTASQIFAYGDVSEGDFNEYAKITEEALEYYHKLFDIYYEYAGVNNIKTINRNAGKEPVKVDRELVDFLVYCKELYTLTKGKTNIMLGSVLEIWHDAREEANGDFGYLRPEYLPTEEELSEANAHTSIDSLVINEEECTVYISDKYASIDVGAIAKGYAVERIYGKLKGIGADSVFVNVGGNIRTVGLKPDGKTWSTGIRNPDKEAENNVKCWISLGESSIVTSGDYERFFISDGQKYHHIIDPVTLMPADYFSSVTVVTPNSALADALSTALFCMSYEEGALLVGGLENVEAVWIFKDGTLGATDGINMQ